LLNIAHKIQEAKL